MLKDFEQTRGIKVGAAELSGGERQRLALAHAAVLHDGRIEPAGSPGEIYERPSTAFFASFLGRCAVLSGSLHDGDVETALGTLLGGGGGAAKGEVSVVIRPEDVCVDDDGAFSGRVESVTCLGGSFETTIIGRGWRMWALTRDELRPGSLLRFAVKKSVTVYP